MMGWDEDPLPILRTLQQVMLSVGLGPVHLAPVWQGFLVVDGWDGMTWSQLGTMGPT